MKKIIGMGLLVLLGIIFLAPWMPVDHYLTQEEWTQHCTVAPETTYVYRWRPFGRRVTMCKGSWYMTFFGRVLYYGPSPLK